jgi:hypothetical protein
MKETLKYILVSSCSTLLIYVVWTYLTLDFYDMIHYVLNCITKDIESRLALLMVVLSKACFDGGFYITHLKS